MPRKPTHPKDRPPIKAKKLQAMATLALAIKSEVDCLMAQIPFKLGAMRWITIDSHTFSNGVRDFCVRALELAEGEPASGGECKLQYLPPTFGSVRFLPLLAEQIAAEADLNGHYVPLKATVTAVSEHRQSHRISLHAAFEFLASVTPVLSERQGLGYQMNAQIGKVISSYVAVLLDHHQASPTPKGRRSKGVLKPAGSVVVPITSWAKMIAAFRSRQQHSHYPDLHLLEGSDSQRKRAGRVAQAIGLIQIMPTRKVEVLPDGVKHYKDCLAAIKANQPLPEPFPP